MTIYPLTVHDLWLALTRLPTHAQSLPVSVGRGEDWYDVTGVDMDGPEGGVALEMSMTPTSDCERDSLAAAQADVLKMLTLFELTVLYPKIGPPPPPIPMTEQARKLLADIRNRFEQVKADVDDEIPF